METTEEEANKYNDADGVWENNLSSKFNPIEKPADFAHERVYKDALLNNLWYSTKTTKDNLDKFMFSKEKARVDVEWRGVKLILNTDSRSTPFCISDIAKLNA